jgi:hypothetical protein
LLLAFSALEHYQKYCGHTEAVLLGFGFVSAQSQGSLNLLRSPKPRQKSEPDRPKNPRSEWPQNFFKRSRRFQITEAFAALFSEYEPGWFLNFVHAGDFTVVTWTFAVHAAAF